LLRIPPDSSLAIRRYREVDFLNVGIGPFRTGIFNVVDVAIVGGCNNSVFYSITQTKEKSLTSPFKRTETPLRYVPAREGNFRQKLTLYALNVIFMQIR